MWGRRRRAATGGERPDAEDIDLVSVGRSVVREVHAEPTHRLGGHLDDIELVYVIAGQHVGQAGEPGIRMTWHQGQNTFGLLLPMGRLIHEAGAVESIAYYLRLAINEPHGPTPDQSRLWFLDLPSGPY